MPARFSRRPRFAPPRACAMNRALAGRIGLRQAEEPHRLAAVGTPREGVAVVDRAEAS